MGRSGQLGFQGGGPQWIGTSLGKPQGEFPVLCALSIRKNDYTGGEKKQNKTEKSREHWGIVNHVVHDLHD